MGIRYADLPKTFQDAVHVTRKLKCRYLWIDSLCIVQDDAKDWEAEASKMHKYYTQALLTISAADGYDSTSGLFRDRDGSAYQACVVEAAGRKLYASTNSMSVELKRSSLSPSFKRTRLYTRAWVFQEQVLSLRILTYTKDRISWRCQAMVFDERVPFARPIESFLREQYSSNVLTMKGDLRTTDGQIARLQRECIFAQREPASDIGQNTHYSGHNENPNFSAEDEFMIQWGNIVKEYTQRDLTFQKDKLLAIRGIADALSSQVVKSYFAGSWVDTPRAMIMSLLWTRAPGSKLSPRLDLAPTWSWASTSSAVSWPGHLLRRLRTIAAVNDLTSSAASKQTHGKLCLSTNVRLGIINDKTLTSIHAWPDKGLERETPLLIHQSTSVVASRALLNQALVAISFDEHLENKTSVCLAELVMGETNTRGQEQVHCLVLSRCLGDEVEFRRIGYVVWAREHWSQGNALPVSKTMQLVLV
ncbi:HET-domain-containing protein [Paramyrothecium foliicola]|nr:HET-domain-containing protein [Paramyrothecium foliicola]